MNGEMVAKACVALLVGLILAGCNPFDAGTSAKQQTPGAGAFAPLMTVPLKLPRLAPGQSCPFSTLSRPDAQVGMALGSGPVFAMNLEFVGGDLEHLNKIAWAADPRYSGPIRIRGGRIDGGGQVLFANSDNRWRGGAIKTVDRTPLYAELDLLESNSRFPNVSQRWRMWPSLMYVDTPGCYGWQVDGLGFTEVFTFHTLDLPSLPSGAPCPNSPQQVAHNLSPEFGYGPAVGAGPIYPLMGEMQDGVLRYSARNNGWAQSKVLWMAKPSVTGTVVIRGRQIDGPSDGRNWIGFGKAEDAAFVLPWEIGSQTGWASLPSEIRIRAPGCYAFQVDSQQGSENIAFQVVGVP